VTYNVSDAAGNPATEVSRTVNVVAAPPVDTIPPIITLLGTTPIDVVQGATYTDAGATAEDDTDGDITGNIVTVNPVDTNTPGTYIVTYNARDAAGNDAAEVSRTVNVTAVPEDDWYTISPDGNVYTVGESSVTVDANSFTITVVNGIIIFEEQSSNDPKVYIELMSNEKVITGYTEGGVKKLTANSEFAPGTKVSIVAGSILIKTPVTDNITLRGL